MKRFYALIFTLLITASMTTVTSASPRKLKPDLTIPTEGR